MKENTRVQLSDLRSELSVSHPGTGCRELDILDSHGEDWTIFLWKSICPSQLFIVDYSLSDEPENRDSWLAV